jgi:arylformamidase
MENGMDLSLALDIGSWIDISVPLQATIPTFPGDPTYTRDLPISIAAGAICNVSRLDMGAHTGTHLDAPSHFIDGAPASESIPLDALNGPAWVVDATRLSATIEAADLDGLDIPAGERRLLFRTRNSTTDLWGAPGFSEAFVALGADAATALVGRGIRLVGIDYLSIAPFGVPVATHEALLGARVAILEGTDLRGVEPGPVDLLCLPIRLVGSDGVPARAFVRPRPRP